MYLLKYQKKLLLHSEICDYQSLTPDKELDVKIDKPLVKKLFGKLKRNSTSKAKKIRRTLVSILEGQRTLPEVFNGTCNKALHFIRQGLLKVHKKTDSTKSQGESK